MNTKTETIVAQNIRESESMHNEAAQINSNIVDSFLLSALEV